MVDRSGGGVVRGRSWVEGYAGGSTVGGRHLRVVLKL